MDIRQLRLFCRIVDRRSFSLAADELHITQPAASQQVRSLERELKTTLLDRSRRTVVPTDSGPGALPLRTRDPRPARARLHRDPRPRRAGRRTRRRRAPRPAPASTCCPACSRASRRSIPGVRIVAARRRHARRGGARAGARVRARRRRRGDAAAGAGRRAARARRARPRLQPVASLGATRASVTLADVVAEPQIVQQPGAGVRTVVEQHLRDHGVRPERLNVVMEMGLMESAKQAAIAGGGVTFLSRWAIGPEMEHGALVVVPIEGLPASCATSTRCAPRRASSRAPPRRCSRSSASSTRRPADPHAARRPQACGRRASSRPPGVRETAGHECPPIETSSPGADPRPQSSIGGPREA